MSSQEVTTLIQEVFPTIIQVFQQQRPGTTWGESKNMDEEHGEEFDLVFEHALDTLDRATMALHLSHSAPNRAERVRFGRQALEGFTGALAQLEQVEEHIRATESWRVWREEAQKGISSSRKLLL
jgi:hypothetical protein